MLFDKLKKYARQPIVPLHMPGHKRNTNLLGSDLPYEIDITEIDGFDDLHNRTGVLKDSADAAARLYGCRRAFPLVNGATGGLLAAVRAMTRRGDTVIAGRNSHKAVYNAIELCGLRPVWLMPDIDAMTGIAGSIRPEQVAAALDAHPGARLVIVTSPTYEGVVSNIAAIAETTHARGATLLVDAAHGAHFGFSDVFPPSPVTRGADIAVVSLHKTLPSLTQTALTLTSGGCDDARLAAELAVFQTSSPSYVLLASIDRCVRLMASRGEQLFSDYKKRLEDFSARMSSLRHLRVVSCGMDDLVSYPAFFGFDPGKLVIVTRGTDITGAQLQSVLREQYQIELEMAGNGYALAMTSVCDTPEIMHRLADALIEIDASATAGDPAPLIGLPPPETMMTPSDAALLDGEPTPLGDAAGRVALEYVWAYPPGVPFVVPGERVTDEAVQAVRQSNALGLSVRSTCGGVPDTLVTAAVDVDKRASLW